MIIRTAEKKDIEKIAQTYVHNHRTTYKNLLPEEYFKNLTEEYERHLIWTNPGVTA